MDEDRADRWRTWGREFASDIPKNFSVEIPTSRSTTLSTRVSAMDSAARIRLPHPILSAHLMNRRARCQHPMTFFRTDDVPPPRAQGDTFRKDIILEVFS